MEQVYVGMRGGILELNLTKRTFIFYLYKEIPFGSRAVDHHTPMYKTDNVDGCN